MSHRSRGEHFQAIYARYRQADGKLKQVILNEFCANTGYHRKYAIQLLNGPPPGRARQNLLWNEWWETHSMEAAVQP